MYKIKRFSLVSKAKAGWNKLGPKGKVAVGSLLTAGTAIGAKKAYDNREKIIDYVKKNPDEALVLGGSYAIPGALAAKLAKSGKGKAAAAVGSIAVFPIGEGYVAAKAAYRAKKNKDKKEN